MTAHIYTVRGQPATRYQVQLGERFTITIQRRRRSLVWTDCCKRLRWAGNCTIQVYYDGSYHWCKSRHGCKS